MALFRINWLRRFVRRHTNPIPEDRAAQTKQRLSYLYMFFAWNAFGVVAFAMWSGKSNWGVFHNLEEDSDSPAKNYAKMLKIDRAHVVRITGLKKQEEYDIERSPEDDSIVRKDNSNEATAV